MSARKGSVFLVLGSDKDGRDAVSLCCFRVLLFSHLTWIRFELHFASCPGA